MAEIKASVHIKTDDVDGWTVEANIECEQCGCLQISVHPNCERIECQICGYMMPT